MEKPVKKGMFIVVLCALSLFINPVQANTTDKEVRQFMESYLSSFDTGYSRDVANYYAESMLMLAPNGDLRSFDTPKVIHRTVKKWKRYLFHHGFKSSRWVDLNVRALSDNTALVSTVFERLNSRGEVFQRGAATYTLRRREDDWKIWLIHIHDPNRVFSFN